MTEEPIHCWGTGTFRQAAKKEHNSSMQLNNTSSWVSTRSRWEASSFKAVACFPLCPLWRSTKRGKYSDAVSLCKWKRFSFLASVKHFMPPLSSRARTSALVWDAGGQSKPSKREPWPEEFVSESRHDWRQAAKELLPCQPATAVTMPILMSSIRHSL